MISSTVSVIIPCHNEKDYIFKCIDSVLACNYRGDVEIIVVDGQSDDGTREILNELEGRIECLKVFDNPEKIAPVAMNIGIRVAQGEVVIILGAHCEIAPEYIQKVVDSLMSSQSIGCAGGRTVAKTVGFLPEIFAAVLSSTFGVGNSYFRIPGKKVKEVDTVAFGAYRNKIFEQIGGFDERLVRNQDIEFNTRLRKAGYKILLDPSTEVYYRPRRTVNSFCKQNFGNGYWNIITTRLIPGTLSWRHFVPLVFVLTILLSGLGSFFWSWAWYLFLFVCVSYLFVDIVESFRIAVDRRKAYFLFSFFVFPMLHISYGLGSVWAFLVGNIDK